LTYSTFMTLKHQGRRTLLQWTGPLQKA